MFGLTTKWIGFGTFEYRNKKKQLVIIDRFFASQRKKFSFDVNIFNDNSDAHIFTELFVTPSRLRYIINLYQFDKNIIDEVCDNS